MTRASVTGCIGETVWVVWRRHTMASQIFSVFTVTQSTLNVSDPLLTRKWCAFAGAPGFLSTATARFISERALDLEVCLIAAGIANLVRIWTVRAQAAMTVMILLLLTCSDLLNRICIALISIFGI